MVPGAGSRFRPVVPKGVRIANGRTIRALGRTTVNCAFAKDPTVELRCLFYVFETLISPLIMGMAFLEETETLAKYRHRLEPRTIPQNLPLQLCSLDYPRRHLCCLANSQMKFANADTGSEIDLMSLSYVQKQGFPLQEVDLLNSIIQFADGSIAQMLGKVEVQISLNMHSEPSHGRDFYISEGLTCDILFGEDFLITAGAFESYADAFQMDKDDDGVCQINPIVWLNVLESKLAQTFRRGSVPSNQVLGKLNIQTITLSKKCPKLESEFCVNIFFLTTEEDSLLRKIHRRLGGIFSSSGDKTRGIKVSEGRPSLLGEPLR